MVTTTKVPALKLTDLSITRKGDEKYSFVLKGFDKQDPTSTAKILEDIDPPVFMYCFVLRYFSTEYLDVSIKNKIEYAIQAVKLRCIKDYGVRKEEFRRNVGHTSASSPYTWLTMAVLYKHQEAGTLEEYLRSNISNLQNYPDLKEIDHRGFKLKYNLLLLHHEEMIEDFKKYVQLFCSTLHSAKI